MAWRVRLVDFSLSHFFIFAWVWVIHSRLSEFIKLNLYTHQIGVEQINTKQDYEVSQEFIGV